MLVTLALSLLVIAAVEGLLAPGRSAAAGSAVNAAKPVETLPPGTPKPELHAIDQQEDSELAAREKSELGKVRADFKSQRKTVRERYAGRRKELTAGR
jgi:hypothetical protein